MKTMRPWFAAVIASAAALALAGAGYVAEEPTTVPATQPTTQPATQPVSLASFAGEKPDEWASYQAMHAYILDRFIRSAGFGLERVERVEDLPRSKRIYADGTRYTVGRVQLISLNDGDEPFVYETKFGDVMKNQLKRARHVPLNKMERSALDELNGGKEVVLTGTGEGREFIGAVRAASACTQCHSVPQGTLLGAFRYPLIEERAPEQR